MAYPPPNPYDSTAGMPESYGSVPVPKADDPVATFSLAVANFVNRAVIGHPCTVLRRQCQVHQFATKLHLTPFSLVPVACYVVGKD
ncbi:Protein Y40B1B.8, partial [Aphelenchoides avenae]